MKIKYIVVQYESNTGETFAQTSPTICLMIISANREHLINIVSFIYFSANQHTRIFIKPDLSFSDPSVSGVNGVTCQLLLEELVKEGHGPSRSRSNPSLSRSGTPSKNHELDPIFHMWKGFVLVQQLCHHPSSISKFSKPLDWKQENWIGPSNKKIFNLENAPRSS